MDAEAAATTPGPSKQEMLAGSLVMALEMSNRKLDTCQLLVAQTKDHNRIAESKRLDAAARGLSRGRRMEIDGKLSQFQHDVPGMLETILREKLVGFGSNAGVFEEFNPEEHHSLSSEQLAFSAQYLSTAEMEADFNGRFSVYADDPIAANYLNAAMIVATRESPMALLGTSLLPTLISNFETYLAAVVRSGLFLHPRGLGDLPPVPSQLVARFATKNDIELYLVDRKVAEFMRGTPAEWRERIRKWANIDMRELSSQWDTILEAVQRRHAVIHNDSRADENYLQNSPRTKVEGIRLGQRLFCPPGYISGLIDAMRVFCITLGISWIAHFAKTSPIERLPNLISSLVKLEEKKDWAKALELATPALMVERRYGGSAPTVDRQYLEVNRWLCIQRLDLDDLNTMAEIRAFQPLDEQLLAARLALLRDWSGLATHVRRICVGPGAVSQKRRFIEAPMFADALEKSAEVRRALGIEHGSSARSTKGVRSRRKR